MNLRTIDDLDAPALRHFRTLRRPEEHLREGLFIAEGEKVAVRLLQSGLRVVSVLLTPEWLEVHRSAIEAITPMPDIYVAQKDLLESIVGFPLHQGIMALGRVPEERLLDEVLRSSPRPRLIAALDGLANAENVGVVVRNAAAFGVQLLAVGETSSSPYLRRSVRNSMGTIFRLPVIHTASLATLLEDLHKEHGIRIIAADADPAAIPIHTCDLRGDVCLVFGSEGNGLRQEVLERCQDRVVIPMQAGVDSLNVASASAAVLYEVGRQRGMR